MTEKSRVRLLFLVILVILGLSCTKSTKTVIEKAPSEIQNTVVEENDMKNDNDQNNEIDTLIEKLNYWAAAGGDPDHPIDSITSTGESTSAFEKIMEKLKKNKIKVKWIDNKYVLDTTNTQQ